MKIVVLDLNYLFAKWLNLTSGLHFNRTIHVHLSWASSEASEINRSIINILLVATLTGSFFALHIGRHFQIGGKLWLNFFLPPCIGRDAQDAVYGRNGYDYGIYRLRVEFQRGRGVGGGSRGRPGPTARRSDFRVIVSGLPSSGSWQDLKDHMREAGDVCYADVLGEGAGVVEFLRKEDMDYAVRKLDDTKFRSHEGETAYIRVRADKPRSSSYGRSRSRSLSRGRYSPYQSRSSPRYSPRPQYR
ncbi:serine/arginine-rich splicing factor 9-like [Mustelus asterias]